MKTKRCSKCGKSLSVKKFHNNKNTKNGLAGWCKNCRIPYAKEYYSKNKERYKRQAQGYYKKNKERINQQTKVYHTRIKQDILAWIIILACCLAFWWLAIRSLNSG